MLYKGLGCRQNYSSAIEQFQTAATFNHSSAIFMLGLCYRNGYNVEADFSIANLYLRQAAKLGMQDAMEELMKAEPENSAQTHEAIIDETLDVPSAMPAMVPYIPNQYISGLYRGVLATYD